MALKLGLCYAVAFCWHILGSTVPIEKTISLNHNKVIVTNHLYPMMRHFYPDGCGLFCWMGELMQISIHNHNHLHYSCNTYLLAVVVISFLTVTAHLSYPCPLSISGYCLCRTTAACIRAMSALAEVIKDRNRTSTENGCNVDESIRIVEQGHASYNHHHSGSSLGQAWNWWMFLS